MPCETRRGALSDGALGGYVGAQFGGGSGAMAMTGLGVAAGAALGRELARNIEAANNYPAVQQYVFLPNGYSMRPLNGSSHVEGQTPNGWAVSTC